MSLPDPRRSRAVLFGTASYHYAKFTDLPAVANNLTRLAELLTDHKIWGLPIENCVVIREAESPLIVLNAIHDAVQHATDTLLVYYAGHGLLDQSDLLLLLPDSEPDKPYLSVEYDQVRKLVFKARRCPSRIVILDCCYSGRAMVGGMAAGVTALADRAAVEGSWLVTAAAETKEALAPPGETYTAFTGELVSLLEQGVADGPEFLTVDSLYWKMHAELLAKGRPEPQQRARNNGARIVLARNRWRLSGPVGDKEAAVAPLCGWVDDLPSSPAELIAEIDRRRDAGNGRDDIPATIGRHRSVQQVAAFLHALDSAGRIGEVYATLTGVQDRNLQDVRSIVQILLLLDLTEIVHVLLTVFADDMPERIAQLASLLQNTSDIGTSRYAEVLLDLTVTAGRNKPRRIIDLVTNLLIRDLQAAAEHVLEKVAKQVSGTEAMQVADALREAGRDAAAYHLYSLAVEAVADREATELASIADGLRSHGMTEASRTLIRTALARRDMPSAYVDIIAALAATHSFSDEMRQVLDDLSVRLDPDSIIQLVGMLWHRRLDDQPVHLLTAAAAREPIAVAVRFINHLVNQGRPVDALELLSVVAVGRTAAEIDTLIRQIADTPRRSLGRHLLACVPADPPATAAELYRLLHEVDDGRLALWQSELARRPLPQVVAVIREQVLAGATAFGVDLLEATIQGDRHLDPAEVCAIAARLGPDATSAMVLVAAQAPVGGEILEALLVGLTNLPADRVAGIIERLIDEGLRGTCRQVLTAVVQGSARYVDAVLQNLRDPPSAMAVTEILNGFRALHSQDLDVFDLAARLRVRGAIQQSEDLLQGRSWLPLQETDDALATAVAEILHDARIQMKRVYRYPVDASKVSELRGAGLVTDREVCLLVLRWSTPNHRQGIVFTQRAALHWTGSRLDYRELTEVESIVEVAGELSLVRRGDDVGNRMIRWNLSGSEEAAVVVRLLRAIQAAAHHLARTGAIP